MSTATRDKKSKKRTPDPAVTGDDLPAGDMTPCPRWALLAAAAAWGGWLLFIIAMAVMRGIQDPNQAGV